MRPAIVVTTLSVLALAAWAFWPPAASPPITEQRDLTLKQTADRLRPLHSPLPDPRPGDWLDQHHERGQTFAQYLGSKPVTALGERRVL